MQTTFTIEEIKKYLLSKDDMGDIMYYLSAENIIKANTQNDDIDDEEPLHQKDLFDYLITNDAYENFKFIGIDGYEYLFDLNKCNNLEQIAFSNNDDFLIPELIGPTKEHLIKMIDNNIVTLVED